MLNKAVNAVFLDVHHCLHRPTTNVSPELTDVSNFSTKYVLSCLAIVVFQQQTSYLGEKNSSYLLRLRHRSIVYRTSDKIQHKYYIHCGDYHVFCCNNSLQMFNVSQEIPHLPLITYSREKNTLNITTLYLPVRL